MDHRGLGRFLADNDRVSLEQDDAGSGQVPFAVEDGLGMSRSVERCDDGIRRPQNISQR